MFPVHFFSLSTISWIDLSTPENSYKNTSNAQVSILKWRTISRSYRWFEGFRLGREELNLYPRVVQLPSARNSETVTKRRKLVAGYRPIPPDTARYRPIPPNDHKINRGSTPD
jgi:hypothetical protein